MAKASWCTVTPMSGTGNETITISAEPHTGRIARSTTVTVQNQNGDKPRATVTVGQAASPLFATLQHPTGVVAIPAAGGFVKVRVESNAKFMFITEGENDRLASGSHTGKLNGNAINLEESSALLILEPSGDIGASGKYTFEIDVRIADNESATPIEGEICFQCFAEGTPISPIGGSSDLSVPFNQAARPSTLNLNKASLSLTKEGTAQAVDIASNDSWTVV